jgi:hypothetical protein
MIRTRSKGDPAASRAFAVDLAQACLLDKCTDVVVRDVGGVSLFEPGQREYYDLESLWADGKPVEVPAPTRAAG